MRALTIADINDQVGGGEPRVRDLDLANSLGFDRARNIRNLIERNLSELGRYGGVLLVPSGGDSLHGEANSPGGTAPPPPRRGAPGQEYWLNEQQAVLVCMFARTPLAAAVRQQVIEVFVAWRQGRLPAAPAGAYRPAPRPLPISHSLANKVRYWQGQRDLCDARLDELMKLAEAEMAFDRRVAEAEADQQRRIAEHQQAEEEEFQDFARRWRESYGDETS